MRFGLREPAETMWDIFRRSRGAGFGPEVKRRIMLGTYALSAGYYDAYYGQAQKVRTLIRQDFDQRLPAGRPDRLPRSPPPPPSASASTATTRWRCTWKMSSPCRPTWPASLGWLSRCGFDAAGLPIGMQLMGPHFREDLLFRAAHAYQQVTDWHTRAPSL